MKHISIQLWSSAESCQKVLMSPPDLEVEMSSPLDSKEVLTGVLQFGMWTCTWAFCNRNYQLVLTSQEKSLEMSESDFPSNIQCYSTGLDTAWPHPQYPLTTFIVLPLSFPCASVCWPTSCLRIQPAPAAPVVMWLFPFRGCGTEPVSQRIAGSPLSWHLLALPLSMFFNAGWLIIHYVKYCFGSI